VLEFHQEDLDKCTHDAVGRTISHAVSWSEGSLPVDLCRTHNEDTTPLEQTDNLGRTVLHYASRRSNVEIVESLLQHKKARLARPDNEGRTPMHLASESERSAQTIDTLVRSGLDSHAVDHQGRTVLHIAASAGNVPAVEKLLEHGADADMHVVDENGHTPFQLAATLRRAAVVDVLRSRGWGAQSLELPEDEEEAEVSMVSYTGAVGKQSLDILCAVHKALEVVGLCALVWIGLRFWNIA
jgi:ankyrin repeat protein